MKETSILYLYRERQSPHRCYVGKKLFTQNKRRDKDHRRAKSRAPKFNNWVRKHVIDGGVPFDDVLEYFELETYHGDNVAEREHRYIDLWNAIGNGWNIEKNGAGGSKSKETIEKAKRTFQNPEIKEKHRKAVKLAVNRPDAKKKHSAALQGNQNSKGFKHSAETNRNNSERQKGVPKPNVSKALKGKPKTKEHNLKNSLANKGKKRPYMVIRNKSEKPWLGRKYSIAVKNTPCLL